MLSQRDWPGAAVLRTQPLPARLFLKMWLMCILAPPSFLISPTPSEKNPQHCHKVSVGAGVWKGSSVCSGAGALPGACRASSGRGEQGVWQRRAALLGPATGTSRALLRPGRSPDLPSLPEPD